MTSQDMVVARLYPAWGQRAKQEASPRMQLG